MTLKTIAGFFAGLLFIYLLAAFANGAPSAAAWPPAARLLAACLGGIYAVFYLICAIASAAPPFVRPQDRNGG